MIQNYTPVVQCSTPVLQSSAPVTHSSPVNSHTRLLWSTKVKFGNWIAMQPSQYHTHADRDGDQTACSTSLVFIVCMLCTHAEGLRALALSCSLFHHSSVLSIKNIPFQKKFLWYKPHALTQMVCSTWYN